MKEDAKSVRILQAVGTMNRGGAETMLMTIFRHINPDGFKFIFLTHSDAVGAYDEEILRLGGKLYSIRSLGTLGYIGYFKTLRRFILANGPFDVVHSHLDWQGGVIALAAKSAGVKKIIVHSHSSSWEKPNTFIYRLLHTFNRFLIALCADEGWACSREAGEFLFWKRFFRKGKYRKIPNAIDLDLYSKLTVDKANAMRKTFGIPAQALVFGHVASFSWLKNQKYLIELATELKKKNWNFRIVFVGDGAMRQEVEELASARQVSGETLFLGLREDIPECMNMFDALLLPSVFEGLGIVAIEAQAAGIPCLVSDRVPREVDMDLGLVRHLPLDSPADWITSLENIKDRRCKDRSRINNRITAKGYSIDESIGEIEGLYRLNDE